MAGPASGRVSGRSATALRYLLVPVAAFALGWLGDAAVRGAPAAFAFYLEATERKYLAMTGEIGPVTYLVEHDDVAVLEALAREDDSILGAEPFAFPSSVAVAFVDADAPGIAAVAALPGTGAMRRRRILMICH